MGETGDCWVLDATERDAPVYFDPMWSVIGLGYEKRGQHQQLLEQQPENRGVDVLQGSRVQGPNDAGLLQNSFLTRPYATTELQSFTH